MLTISFANGMVTEIGDLNPGNFESRWNKISWRGGTYITPALDMMMGNFQEEFGELPGMSSPSWSLQY